MSARRAASVLSIAVTAALLVDNASAGAAGIKPVSPPNAYTVGNGLARSSAHLQAVWATDCPPPSGRCATNSGPYMGVFWQRSKSTGGWTTPMRVSPVHVHSARPAIAASGSDLYAAWVTQTRYIGYQPSAKRVLWLRVSTDEGNTWHPSLQLSGSQNRVDYPVLAASGSSAWLVWTNANSGEIRMSTTSDNGQNWYAKTIGTTTSGQGTGEGFRGFPSVGASGSNVAVVWVANNAGKQVTLLSSQGGAEWQDTSTPIVLTSGSPADSSHYPAAHGADDGLSERVAIAYTTNTGVDVNVFDGVVLADARTVAGPWPDTAAGHRYVGAFGPAVAPSGTTDLSVAWAGCEDRSALADPCKSTSSLARIDLLERQSTNDGASWSPTVAIGPNTTTARVNEAPSLVVDPQGTRFIMWLRRMANWASYQVVMTTR
jgi:hypothetical protein